MRYNSILAGLSALSSLTIGALASDVLDLTQGTFKTEVNGEDLALVE